MTEAQDLKSSGGRKLISHCYFDGSGIYFSGASSIDIDSCNFLISNRTRGSLFNFHSSSNISINGIRITNAIISDYRSDTTVDFNLFSIDHGVTTAEGNIAEIRGSSHLILNNPYNIFTWPNSSTAAFSLVDEIEIAQINVSDESITSHSTSGVDTYYDKVAISNNMVETHYIGSTSVYRWVLIPFYVFGKASVKFRSQDGNYGGRIYNADYQKVSTNGKMSTLVPGKYFLAAYRDNKYTINY